MDDSATREMPKPMPDFFFEVWEFGFEVEMGIKGAEETSENMYVSPIRGLRIPLAASIVRALLLPETPVLYATPRILLILPALSRWRVLGRRTWWPNTSWTSPPPPPDPLGPRFDR